MVRAAPANLPKRDQRREMILSVAREMFFEHGYAATSMSCIAARLGGSKGTLYNYFKSKEELFEAQVRDLCGHGAARMLETLEGLPAEALNAVAEEYLNHLFSEQAVKLSRVLVAERQRSPELGRIFYELGPARSIKALETYLEGAKAKGLLDIPNCKVAAEQFLSLCKGPTHLKFLLNLIPAPKPEELREQVAQSVRAFLAIYGSKSA
jgi:AcrR family transcriptional regulator